jgi:AmmeMemoRadiSam system protein B
MAQVDKHDAAAAADPALLDQAAPPALPRRDVLPTASRPLRAIIGPHAGYSYCGHVMAHAYRYIDPARV